MNGQSAGRVGYRALRWLAVWLHGVEVLYEGLKRVAWRGPVCPGCPFAELVRQKGVKHGG